MHLYDLAQSTWQQPSWVGDFCYTVFHPPQMVHVGIPELYHVHARDNEESALLTIRKATFNDLVYTYPDQLDILVTSLLQLYGLTRDGEDAGTSHGENTDEGAVIMRDAIKVTPAMPLSLFLQCSAASAVAVRHVVFGLKLCHRSLLHACQLASPDFETRVHLPSIESCCVRCTDLPLLSGITETVTSNGSWSARGCSNRWRHRDR